MTETSSKGGSETVLASLALGMQERGFRVGAILAEEGWLADELREHEVPVVLVPFAPRKRVPNVFSVVRRIAQALGELEACCVHTFSFQSQFYGCLSARLTRRPCVIGLRSTYYDFAARHRILMWNWVMGPMASLVVTVSEGARRQLLAATRVAPTKVITVPNGVDLSKFARMRDGAQMRRRLGLPGEGLVVGTVGRHYPVKGYHDLLMAAREVVNRIPSTHFAILASHEDPGYPAVAERRRDLALEGSVSLIDRRSDIPEVLAAFDLFVLSSLSEGMSNALLEAMAAGRPTVATAVGGNPEVLGNGDDAAGVLVPASHPRAMAEALVSLLTDPARCRAMGMTARRRAHLLFSREAMLDRYQGLYRRLLRRHLGTIGDASTSRGAVSCA